MRVLYAYVFGDSPISQNVRESLSMKRQAQEAYSAYPASARDCQSVAHYAIALAMPG
ncbi:MAG: hypothetical protein ACO3XJ_03955 [Candidatus Nanopelagicales bacterium]